MGKNPSHLQGVSLSKNVINKRYQWTVELLDHSDYIRPGEYSFLGLLTAPLIGEKREVLE